MKYQTLAELKPVLRRGDWLIPESKSVAIQVCLHEEDDAVELYEDFCKSFPRYKWDYPGRFGVDSQ